MSEIVKSQLFEIIEKTLGTLTPKEADIIRLRYGFYGRPMTLEEVGQRYNVTRERIRQIEVRALRKMRGLKIKAMLMDFEH